MERCECLPLKIRSSHKKSVLVETKPFNRQRQTVISINQLFKAQFACRQPWLPLINGLVDDALLELSPDKN